MNRARKNLLDAVMHTFPIDFFNQSGAHVLAISGGRDSMLLLQLYRELHDRNILCQPPIVFHMHHGLRSEADEDANLVRSEASDSGFRFILIRKDLKRIAARSGIGLEEAGRLLRYRALKKIQQGERTGPVVTAHHADDYIETVLMHLLRKGGRGSFRSMRLLNRVEGALVFRPFLVFNRENIDQYIADTDTSFREDESNRDRQFLRNRIRADMMPLLRREGLDAAKIWKNFHDWQNDLPNDCEHAAKNLVNEPIAIDRRLFARGLPGELKEALDPALRAIGLPPASGGMLREILRSVRGRSGDRHPFRIRYRTEKLEIWSAETGSIWLFHADSHYYKPYEKVWKSQSEVQLIYAGRKRDYTLQAGEKVICWRPGLRLMREGGKKKLKKLFQEMQVPSMVRKNIPLIIRKKDDLIICVCTSFWMNERDQTIGLIQKEVGSR